MTGGNMGTPEPDIVMTVKEVSTYLRLAESTVYKLAREKRLPGRKVGGAWRFSRQQIESWFREPEEELAEG
jgi:excisionase family DNA binding protein